MWGSHGWDDLKVPPRGDKAIGNCSLLSDNAEKMLRHLLGLQFRAFAPSPTSAGTGTTGALCWTIEGPKKPERLLVLVEHAFLTHTLSVNSST